MFITYTHYRTGETFTADTANGYTFGAAALDGVWANGNPGSIWPAERTNTGRLVWSIA